MWRWSGLSAHNRQQSRVNRKGHERLTAGQTQARLVAMHHAAGALQSAQNFGGLVGCDSAANAEGYISLDRLRVVFSVSGSN